jgi:hypothetical protein
VTLSRNKDNGLQHHVVCSCQKAISDQITPLIQRQIEPEEDEGAEIVPKAKEEEEKEEPIRP